MLSQVIFMTIKVFKEVIIMPESTLHINRLIHEKSPYLQQHARNPVDWFPWDDEAFEKAKREDKPVFLSIGYSTCHWCHVMAHESFENDEIAKILNDSFVCIKVDREERPDIDHLYMTVCQMMTGHGGWPLTIIMTPDKKPFYAGTYFPKESRFGRIGLVDLLPRLKWAWEKKRSEITSSADTITDTVREAFGESTAGEEPGLEVIRETYKHLVERFDNVYGGFGEEPKFPMPHNLLFLLRYWKRSGEETPLAMVEKTLKSMSMGGIFDHVGFGFHRYSTDEEWLVPHFEKMLYDQALIAYAYTEAYQATRVTWYKQVVEEIFVYVTRVLRAPEGVFYSAQDADSEGEEGKFYLWTLDEFRDALKEHREKIPILEKIFNVETEGNYRDESTGRRTGRNILHLKRSFEELSRIFKVSETEIQVMINEARQTLREVRDKRVHPDVDTKILTDWNGLMIASLAKAGQVFDNPEYVKMAEKAADYLLHNMKSESGMLVHAQRDAEKPVDGKLDDYAFLSFGLIELYQATFNVSYLRSAIDLSQEMLERFWDKERGGLNFSATTDHDLPLKTREFYDGAIPSGNSVAMLNLLKLARITGDTALEEKAYEIAKAFSSKVRQLPTAHTMLMSAIEFAVGPAYEAVIVGQSANDDTQDLIRTIRQAYLPNAVYLLRPIDEDKPDIERIAPHISSLTGEDGKASVYVCSNSTCLQPSSDKIIILESMKTGGTVS
jgi:uncharacterized protein